MRLAEGHSLRRRLSHACGSSGRAVAGPSTASAHAVSASLSQNRDGVVPPHKSGTSNKHNAGLDHTLARQVRDGNPTRERGTGCQRTCDKSLAYASGYRGSIRDQGPQRKSASPRFFLAIPPYALTYPGHPSTSFLFRDTRDGVFWTTIRFDELCSAFSILK
jgi:hypothetical protein